MQRITIEKLQNDPALIFNNVIDNQEPVAVAFEKDREVVVLDVEDYTSIIKTLHLLSSSANADRLREGILQHRQGQRKVIDVKTENMELEELIAEIEILSQVSEKILESTKFTFSRPFQTKEDKPFCEWCFSGWPQYMPDKDSGIYFICWPKNKVIYIGKATKANLGAEIWGKFGKPSEKNGGKFFDKSYFLSNMPSDI